MIMGKSKNIPIIVRISRQSSNRPPYDSVALVIEDKASGLQILDATLTMEAFGNIVSGLNKEAIAIIYNNFDELGTEHEVKHENIPIDGHNSFHLLAEATKKHEIDGWIAHLDKTWNGHNYNYKTRTYSVMYHRYVNKENK
jgi:hypothetical protein